MDNQPPVTPPPAAPEPNAAPAPDPTTTPVREPSTIPTPAPVAPPAPTAAAEELPPVPTPWLGAFAVYKYSKAAVRFNLGTVVGLLVIDIALSVVLEVFFKQAGLAMGAARLLGNLVGIIFSAATTVTLLAGLRRQEVSLGDSIKQGLSFYWQYLLLTLAIAAASAISLLLLIIPFFFVAPRLLLAPYFLVDKKMNVSEAFKASWEHSKGNLGKIWGIIGATIAMALLMITVIGIPFSIYFLVMYSAAYAVLYGYISQAHAADASAPAPSVSSGDPQPAAPVASQ